MRNKETGEFELVVGNGFLVSGFFIVILLMAVAVSMGYILGKNSERTAQAQQTTAPCVAADSRPQPSPQPTPVPPQTADAQAAGSDQSSPSEPAPTTQPAKQDTPAQDTSARDTAPPPPPKKAAPAADVPSGFFWQVTATANLDAARATLETLSKKGFPAYLAPGPNNLTRVLVGPYSDIPSRAKAKTDLEGMSFKPISHTRE